MMKKTAAVILIFTVLFSLCSCGKEPVDDSLSVEAMTAAEKTNAIKKYSADFLLEVTNAETDALVVFAQGNFDIDKSGSLMMSGTMVQTVDSSPASLYMAYSGGKYYVKSGEISTYTELAEEVFLSQFLCSETLVFDKITEITKKSNGTGGTVYAFRADCKEMQDKLLPLIDTDVFYYIGIKKLQTEKLFADDLRGEYIVNDETGLLKSRTVEYREYAYDTPPYYPNSAVAEDALKVTFNIKIRMTYKSLDGSAAVVLPDFVK